MSVSSNSLSKDLGLTGGPRDVGLRPMPRHKSRCIGRRLGAGILGLALALCLGSAVQAQSPADPQLAELLKRIEKLEQEKQGLSSRLDAIESGGSQPQAPLPAPDQPAVCLLYTSPSPRD